MWYKKFKMFIRLQRVKIKDERQFGKIFVHDAKLTNMLISKSVLTKYQNELF